MSNKSASHFEWIDILRGLSALAVVIFHVRVDLWCGLKEIQAHPQSFSPFDRISALLSLPSLFFGSAVMLFFLLSGFCIHFPQAAGGRPLALSTYFRRRFLRIYPPYLAAVLLTMLVEYGLRAGFGTLPSASPIVLKSVFMLQNYGSQAGQMSSNPSLWSLPVEAELYLVYPLFFWVLTRYGLKVSLAMAAAVSLGALGLALTKDWTVSPYHPSLNFAIFWVIWCAGAALAEGVRRQTLPAWRAQYWLGALAFLVLSTVAQLRHISDDVLHLLWAAFYVFIIWWGLSRPLILQNLHPFLKKSLLFVGTISYSLYLIHFPFFHLCGQAWWHGQAWLHGQGQKPSSFLVALGFCGLSIPVAYLFYLWVEVPSHRVSRRQTNSVVAVGADQSGQPAA